MRSGSELVRASKPYASEDPVRSWTLLITTLLVQASFIAFTVLVPWWPIKLIGSFLVGLTLLRLFIFYHDYLHGAIFVDSTVGKWVMYGVGLWTMAAPSVWKQTHNYHHQNNAKLLGSAIGSYPLVSLGIYKGLKPLDKRLYAMIRHPITIALGLITSFVLGMCVAPFRRDPKQHWQGPLVLVLYVGIAVALWVFFGFGVSLFTFILPGFISAGLGSYLFYAQHNFPGAELRGRKEWDYTHAALKCSSMFEMSPLMHWFTGNIGYHHVHHINHKIPFYRLPEAMAGMPELQDPKVTSWHPADVWGCLRIGLWNAETQQLLTIGEAQQVLADQAAA